MGLLPLPKKERLENSSKNKKTCQSWQKFDQSVQSTEKTGITVRPVDTNTDTEGIEAFWTISILSVS